MDATFSARTTAVSPSCTHSADAGPPSHLLHNHSLGGGVFWGRMAAPASAPTPMFLRQCWICSFRPVFPLCHFRLPKAAPKENKISAA